MALSKGMRAAIAAGAVIVVAGGAALLFWPQRTSSVVAGAGPYARELAACQRGLFDAETRAGFAPEYLANTVWHSVQGERMSIGGQAIMPLDGGGTRRVNYECETLQGDLINSSVRPVASAGTNLNRELR